MYSLSESKMEKITAIILAAGKGTRMRSPKPKVLHEVCGTTLLEYVVEAVQNAEISEIIIVVGYKKEAVRNSLKGIPVKIAEQLEQLGTAHAVLSAKHHLPDLTDTVLVLNGDVPLIKPHTLKKLVSLHTEGGNDVTLLTVSSENPRGYGRISRDSRGCIKGIIEENEATEEEVRIKEINAGVYVFKKKSLWEGLENIVPDNKKGEFYLTDILSVFYREGKRIHGLVSNTASEVLGINTQLDLTVINQIKRDEILRSLMDGGVTIVDPASTFIEKFVEIGEGTRIYPFTYICKNTRIGRCCCIGPFAYIESGTITEDNVQIRNRTDCAFFTEGENG